MKDKKFQVVFGSIMGVGVLGLGYFLFAGWSTNKKLGAEYVETDQNVLSLQKKKLYPNGPNLEKKKEAVAEYVAKVSALQDKVARAQRDLKPVSQQQFPNIISAKYNEVVALAKERGVSLPENFYFGMEVYKNALPKPHACSILEWELDAIHFLVSMFIEAGVESIGALTRETLPQEAADYDAEKAKEELEKSLTTPKGPDVEYQPGRVMETLGFTIKVAGTHDAIQRALTGMANASEYFYWPRQFRIENARKDGPLKGEVFVPRALRIEDLAPEPEPEPEPTTPDATDPPSDDGTTGDAEAALPDPIDDIGAEIAEPAMIDARTIFGDELIHLELDIDLVRFKAPDAPAPDEGTASN